MAKAPKLGPPGYLIGGVAPLVSRGATAVTPAYASVPVFRYPGFAVAHMPRGAEPQPYPTLFYKPAQGQSPYPWPYVPDTAPLVANPYTVSGATGE